MNGRTKLVPILAMALATCSDRPDPNRARRAHLSLDQRLATADPWTGEQVFARCSACHVVGETSGDRDGPNLWGIVDHPVASRSPRFAYTSALKRVGGTWTVERLDRWLTNPRTFAPGTAMAFAGLSDPVDRADVIAYLRRNGPGDPKPSRRVEASGATAAPAASRQ